MYNQNCFANALMEEGVEGLGSMPVGACTIVGIGSGCHLTVGRSHRDSFAVLHWRMGS